MNLSPNFTFEELTRTDNRMLLQKNRDMANANPAIKANLMRVAVELLEPIRALFKVPVQVNSGYRCPELNDSVGGSATSQHVLGEAALAEPGALVAADVEQRALEGAEQRAVERPAHQRLVDMVVERVRRPLVLAVRIERQRVAAHGRTGQGLRGADALDVR